MSAIDKAVSTEDLCAKKLLGVLHLDAILNTLVENKVEAIKLKHHKKDSQSKSKKLLRKFKCKKSAKTIVTIENEKQKKNEQHKHKDKNEKTVSESKQFKRQVLRQETSSPDSQTLHAEDNSKYISSKNPSCLASSCESHTCCYNNKNHRPVSVQLTDDYISLKMDGYGDVETDAMIAQEELRRAKRKRRRRRKRELKKRLALNARLVHTLNQDHESFKVLNDDELPPRAKWTIVATACLLLLMCLLLVGITLRMAPIIDELVREENEKLLNSITHSANLSVVSVLDNNNGFSSDNNNNNNIGKEQ